MTIERFEPEEHLGKLFKRKVLDQMGHSLAEAAHELDVTEDFLEDFIAGNVNSTHEFAKKLADFTETAIEMWLESDNCELCDGEEFDEEEFDGEHGAGPLLAGHQHQEDE